MAKGTKKAKSPKRERRERRFEPRSAVSTRVVSGLGGVGAAAIGAGTYGHFVRSAMEVPGQPLPYAAWVLSAGAVALGASIWLGTSGDAPARVGDGGVALETGDMVRIPWHGVQSITWNAPARRLVVRGTSEAGAETTIQLDARTLPQAVAHVLMEARARVPGVVDEQVGSAQLEPLRVDAGEIVALDPLQVVGKRCASSGTAIQFESDARVCRRCERVYHRAHAPGECRCGGALSPGAAGAGATGDALLRAVAVPGAVPEAQTSGAGDAVDGDATEGGVTEGGAAHQDARSSGVT